MLTLIKKLSKEEADFNTGKLKPNEENMGNWTMSGSAVRAPSQIKESRYLILPEQFDVHVNTEDGKQNDHVT